MKATSFPSRFSVDDDRLDKIARKIRHLNYGPARYVPLPDLGDGSDSYHAVNFLLFMVAIDHDTQRDGITYEGLIDGQTLHGSDLLYALAARAKVARPELFLAPAFSAISTAEVEDLFRNAAGVVPHDVAGRARIFRQCAEHLIAAYGGDASRLVAACANKAGGPDGLFARLSAMPAYADPVSKKANLLRKLLKRAGLFAPDDPEHWDIASDHVVMTMSLRAGIVAVDDAETLDRLKAGAEVDRDVIADLRVSAKTALKQLAARAQVDVDDLDDLFWAFGRKSLRQSTPLPDGGLVQTHLDAMVDPAARVEFVNALNGLDDSSSPLPRTIRTVRGPFTRNY